MWSFPTSQPPKTQDAQDLLMEIRMGNKQINQQAKISQKQSTKNMKNAKDQLRHNNEDAARMYLQNAAYKKNQATNLQRMGLKQQMMTGQIKSMHNQQKVMGSFEKMGYLANQMSPNFEKMAYTMNQFDQNMTKMTVNQKMMEEMMGQQNMSTDPMADEMLNMLKQQVAMEDKIRLDEAVMIKQKQRKIQEMQKRTNKPII